MKLIKNKFFKKYKKSKILKSKIFLNNKFIYLSNIKKNKEFHIISNYKNFLSIPILWLNTTSYANKYLKTIENFKKANKILIYKYRIFSRKIPKNMILKKIQILNFLYLYNFFLTSFFNDLYYLLKKVKYEKNKINHLIILNFVKNKLFINMQNKKKQNYFSLSSGLFIKFFEKKKSFKKNKTIKLLMAKFLRKLIIISKIKTTSLIIKKTPLHLIEFLTLINTPIIHKFINPIEKKIIEETDNSKAIIKFSYFIFLKNLSFSLNKGPQIGRIKRKILRKLVLNNKLID